MLEIFLRYCSGTMDEPSVDPTRLLTCSIVYSDRDDGHGPTYDCCLGGLQ